MKLLLHAGANPDAQEQTGKTSLIMRSASGDRNVVALLLSYNADVNVQSVKGETALMLSKDNSKVVNLLISAGADVFIKDYLDRNAMDYAVENCQPRKLKLLIKQNKSYLKGKSTVSSTCKQVKNLLDSLTIDEKVE